MKRKAIAIIAVILLSGFIGAGFLFSASNRAVTPSGSKPCKESMDECCQKEKGGSVDFESLSGKFFSSLLIN